MSEAALIVDRSAWGSCHNCACDLPDGGNVCDGCPAPVNCSDCGEVLGFGEPGTKCLKCIKFDRSEAGDELSRASTVAELVTIYRKAEADIRRAFALVAGATEALNAAYTLGGTRGVSIQQGHEYVAWDKPESHLVTMRRELWARLVDRLEIRRFMSVKAWAELQKEIDRGECPDITEETVAAMVRQFSARAPAMLEEAVREVFDFLRPPGSHYKRNSEYEVPRRVAITWIIDTWHAKFDKRAPLRPRCEVEQKLTALENVFSSLDGKGSTTKSHLSALSEAIRKTKRGELGQTEYFSFRGYANGALHLEFKRADLLQRFNQIAGGTRLRSKGAA